MPTGDVELAMQLAGLMVTDCCVLSDLPKVFCAVIASLLLEIMYKSCAGEGSPEKETLPSVSRMLADKSAVPI